MVKLKDLVCITLIGMSYQYMLSSCSCSDNTSLSILPLPESVEVKHGTFCCDESKAISFADSSLEKAAGYLSDVIYKATGNRLPLQQGEDGDIRLLLDGKQNVKGGYSLEVNENNVTISSSDYSGVICGISTLNQLFAAGNGKVGIGIPCVNIVDNPRYEWRGVLLDVSRHFFDKEEVKELLDLMAVYKLNKFHWHLIDDQGWRMEIKKYPLLTEKGAWRKLNNLDSICIRRASDEKEPALDIPEDKLKVIDGEMYYGGFYTQDDIREIVEYAGVRGIDIIPEIDMPGHFTAAIDQYPCLVCDGCSGWGKVFSSPICVGKDATLTFCKNVWREVFELFPYKYAHLGADEVDKTNWKECPDCQRRMRENSLKDEFELQSWFVHNMEDFFNENGKYLIGWDEIMEGGLSETATVMWWRSAEKEVVDKVTANGNRVIMCPNYDFYLDYAEAGSSLKRIYDSRMNFDDLTDAQKAKILGLQGNIWGEFIPSREWMQYMAFPRLLAVAETGWSKQGSGYEDFRNRMIGQFDRLDRLNVNYRLPDLEGFFDVNIFLGKADVTVSCHDPKAKVYYTTDGTDPDMNSQVYDKPFTITESDTIAFRAFRPNGRYSKIHRAVYLKKDAFTPAKEGFAPQNKGLTVTWHDGIVKNCADIVNHPVKKEMVIDGIRLPEDSKGNLGLIFKGYFLAHEDGVYSFNLSSDDGSMLYMDGNIVVDDNSNGHTRRDISGQCALAKGWHPVEVRYFDRFTGCLSLEVYGTDGKIMTPVFGY